MTSYPTPEFRRTGLAPGLLGAVVLLAGVVLVGSDGFIWISYAVSILALIVAVFAWQARQWWWLLGLAPIAVLWNPVVPLPFDGVLWQGAQFAASLVFILAGIRIKVPNPEFRGMGRPRADP